MGADEELYETRDSGGSRYLYGKIIQETCPSRYSADLTKTRLVITVVYSIHAFILETNSRKPTLWAEINTEKWSLRDAPLRS